MKRVISAVMVALIALAASASAVIQMPMASQVKPLQHEREFVKINLSAQEGASSSEAAASNQAVPVRKVDKEADKAQTRKISRRVDGQQESSALSVYLMGSIFVEASDDIDRFEPMVETSPGVFQLSSPMECYPGYFYFYVYNLDTDQYEYLYSNTSQVLWPGYTFDVPYNGTTYFRVNKGIYQFTFDYNAKTVSLSGEVLPAEYYLSCSQNNYSPCNPEYKFQQLNDGTGNYSMYVGTLSTRFLITTGSAAIFYGSEDTSKKVKLYEPYKTTLMGGYYILTEDQVISDASLIFNPITEMLTVEGYVDDNPEIDYYIYSNLASENGDYESIPMEKQDDGTWVYDPGKATNTGAFYFQKMIRGTTTEIGIFGALEPYYLQPGTTMPCAESNGYFFNIESGTYKFIFDPEAWTLTVEGSFAPEDYFLINSASPYMSFDNMLTQIEGTSKYTLTTEWPLMSGYYIVSSRNRGYYRSMDGSMLKPGVTYQTGYTGQLIQTENYDNFKAGATVVFDASTEELTITGETVAMDNTFAAYGSACGLVDLVRAQDGDYWTLPDFTQFSEGDFRVIYYDKSVMLIREGYGADQPDYYLLPGEPVKCVDPGYGLNVIDGEYQLKYWQGQTTVMIYERETELSMASINVESVYTTATSADLTFNFININVPDNALLYANIELENETETIVVVGGHDATDVRNFYYLFNYLTPNKAYRYIVSAWLDIDGTIVNLPIVQGDFATDNIEISMQNYNIAATAHAISWDYSIYENTYSQNKYTLYYSITENPTGIDWDYAANEAVYETRSLDTNFGSITFDGLKSETFYIIYMYVETEISGEKYRCPGYYCVYSTTPSENAAIYLNATVNDITDSTATIECTIIAVGVPDYADLVLYVYKEFSGYYYDWKVENYSSNLVEVEGLVPDFTQDITLIVRAFYDYTTLESEKVTLTVTTLGIENVTVDECDPIYFDLQGNRVNNPAAGMYIEVRGSQSRKVYIK